MAKKSFNGWKWFLLFGIAAVLIGGGAYYFAGKDDAAPQFQTVTVTRGDLTQAVTASGTLNPVTNITVGSQISGIIQTLYVDWNSPVKAGQVVAQLDPATYQVNVRSAEADLANVKANLELARIQAKRATELFSNKLISESEYDTTAATLHQSEAMVQIKQASLDNAKVNLARCTIYSPVDGTVISRNVDVGQTVAASLSAPTLFIIANDLAQMQIDANVSEADIGSVEENQNVSFTVDAFPDRKFTGKVRQIRNSPTTVQNVVTYNAVIDVANPELKLRPGMTANASIITAQRTGVFKIPNAALRFRPPEPSTNTTFAEQMLAKMGLGKPTKPVALNALPAVKNGPTNTVEAAAAGEAPLTGNEPPQELMRRVRELRERGEELPPAIRTKMRELYQSGVLQRPAGGGPGEGGGRGTGAGTRSRAAQPTSRNIYLLTTNTPASSGDAPVALQTVRVKTGISDGAFTEITDGLNEGDVVITAIKLPPAQAAAAPGGSSPFGGGGGGGFGRGGGGGGGGR